MSKLNAILSIFTLTFSWLINYAQDPQFSQFYAAQLYLNPAFTGNTAMFRIAGNYRNQWPQVPGAFVSYTFAYDQHIEKLSSGVGLLFVRDKAGSAALRYTSIGGFYAFKAGIRRNLTLNLGIRASYIFRALNYGGLKFGDQYLRNDGSTTELPVHTAISYPDFGFGFVFYSPYYWLGAALDHLNSPNQSLTGATTRLPLKISLHGGYEFILKKNEKEISILSIIVAANYKRQLRWDQLDAGAYFKRHPFIFGFWYRGIPLLKAYQPGYMNNDAIIALIGIEVKKLLYIGYSYDLTISALSYKSGGAHEVAVIYEFAQSDYKRENRRRKFIVPCAKF